MKKDTLLQTKYGVRLVPFVLIWQRLGEKEDCMPHLLLLLNDCEGEAEAKQVWLKLALRYQDLSLETEENLSSV